ncbi:MAG: peptidylprolyl isomerase [Caulobacteraceae bacterium]|nr:peptidylprolyl isomerase [Caulobacteraceae bacterium]
MTFGIARRVLLTGGLALAAAPALAQSGAAPAPPDADLARVVMKTAKGAITLDLDIGRAPITAGNFLRYVALKRFDGSSFYRVSHIKEQPTYGLIEGGLRGDPAKVLKPIAHESTLKTGLTHKDGTISMARRAPGTATADFFICVGDQPGFDADPTGAGDKYGFAAFGQVVDGMDVAHAIFALPTSPTAGVGVMRGEMLKPPVPILSVRRLG